jgi:hypothetical protein
MNFRRDQFFSVPDSPSLIVGIGDRGVAIFSDARGAEERPGPTSLSGRALVQMRRGSAVAAPKFICHRTLHPPPPYPSETLAYLVGGGSSGDGGGGTPPSVQESPPCSAPGPQRTGQTRPVPPVLLSFLILLSPL